MNYLESHGTYTRELQHLSYSHKVNLYFTYMPNNEEIFYLQSILDTRHTKGILSRSFNGSGFQLQVIN